MSVRVLPNTMQREAEMGFDFLPNAAQLVSNTKQIMYNLE